MKKILMAFLACLVMISISGCVDVNTIDVNAIYDDNAKIVAYGNYFFPSAYVYDYALSDTVTGAHTVWL